MAELTGHWKDCIEDLSPSETLPGARNDVVSFHSTLQPREAICLAETANSQLSGPERDVRPQLHFPMKQSACVSRYSKLFQFLLCSEQWKQIMFPTWKPGNVCLIKALYWELMQHTLKCTRIKTQILLTPVNMFLSKVEGRERNIESLCGEPMVVQHH